MDRLTLRELHQIREMQGMSPRRLEFMLRSALGSGDQSRANRIEQIMGRHRFEDAQLSPSQQTEPGFLASMFARLNQMNPFGRVSDVLGE